ncbi:hypothetical protein DPMN_019767 [Dreissena polymorpha]|uniref:Uncharacterized protein n=1 Tax=Dreissena polymorpha TaxID=45954 RepID=A0A9D4NLL0_DREPO|nr:hypothetical protein DPMN_019767 [Dreissena polymorpha]
MRAGWLAGWRAGWLAGWRAGGTSLKMALANSVDPDETLHGAASHQGLRCLLIGISEVYEEEDNALFMSKDPTDKPILAGYLINSPAVYLNLAWIYMVLATKPGSGKTGLNPFSAGNRILKAYANSLDPDETPQNVASHQDPNCLLL